ncbi:TorD/DmsD family molecular chaperone [Franzmannia qiaohouensis]|uniref:Molecular chaperone TorD family protein n=1 Tax=Franzmannia qiaohouensis TaxID=1329370 RepID=A0ABU1HEE7_9GAMM|nr:molecular chaperone TorD family protein [Halomonas qiaohouensis]MDR5905838.1 molecular chaperone TorD family protein [Halomonas qiaohouensis]
MNHATDTPTAIDDSDALRADVYRLLGRLLSAPPDAELLTFVAELEAEGDDTALSQAWQSLAQAADAADSEALARDHFRHLVGVIQGEVVPYASWYLHGTLMDEPVVAVRRDLRRLGLERDPAVKEPEDHLAALCDAMAWLIEQTPAEQASFFNHHLASWGERCMHDLAAVDTPFYASVGRLGQAYLAMEAERHDAALSAVRIVDPAPN